MQSHVPSPVNFSGCIRFLITKFKFQRDKISAFDGQANLVVGNGMRWFFLLETKEKRNVKSGNHLQRKIFFIPCSARKGLKAIFKKSVNLQFFGRQSVVSNNFHLMSQNANKHGLSETVFKLLLGMGEKRTKAGFAKGKNFSQQQNSTNRMIKSIMERTIKDCADLKDIKGQLETTLADLDKEIAVLNKMQILANRASRFQCAQDYATMMEQFEEMMKHASEPRPLLAITASASTPTPTDEDGSKSDEESEEPEMKPAVGITALVPYSSSDSDSE